MRKSQAERLILFILVLVLSALGVGAERINRSLQIPVIADISFWLLVASIILFVLLILEYLLSNRIFRGFRYFLHYRSVKNSLEHQLLDAGYGIQRSYYIELPKIKLSFDKDIKSGILKVRNCMKFDNKLDKAAISAGLGKFFVERHYLSDDCNHYHYHFLDGSVSFKQTFNTFQDFLKHSKTIPTYKLFLDKRTIVKLQSTLIIGITGGGKTYAVYNILLQMLNKEEVLFETFVADPKGSSLSIAHSVIGSISEERTAVEADKIIELLEEFVNLMRERKSELKERLRSKVDADYSDFGLKPYVFLFDEYASFATAKMDKSAKDKAKALLYECILQGRQLGFHIMLIMQKSDATLIDTALRDNIPLKIVLGASEPQTYVTAFGAGVATNRHYEIGEGVFTEPTLAPQPKLVQFPYLGFDILEALQEPP